MNLRQVLISLVAVASCYTPNRNPRKIRQISPEEAPSTGINDESTTSFVEMSSRSIDASTRTRRSGRTRTGEGIVTKQSLAAPLVDSALLRFMSSQKNLRPSENGIALQVNNEDVSQSVSETIPYSIREYSDPKSAVVEDPLVTTIMGSQQKQKTEDSFDHWLGQFNSNRVAQLLKSKGEIDDSLAEKAGASVQAHVLARVARRRVRLFLKERESRWVKGQQRDLEAKVTIKNSFIVPDYGLEDIVTLMLEFGFTTKDVATILGHTPSLALMMPHRPESSTQNVTSEKLAGGETLEETLTRGFLDLLCGTLNLRKYDARKVVRACPGLLTMRGSKAAEQVVSMFITLGVSSSSIARDKNALPFLLSRSPSALFRLISFLSSVAIRMPVSKIGPLLRGKDCLQVLDAVSPVIWAEEGNAAKGYDGVTDVGLLAVLYNDAAEQRRERINEVYRNMTETAWTLRHEIGTEDLARVIAAYPSVLLLSGKNKILPTASYLINELGIWEDDLPKVLQQYPMLLGTEVSHMKKVVSFLLELEVAPESVSTIFRSFPALLNLDIEEDMLPIVNFLRAIGIVNIGRFIARLPPILGYSIERELFPKWLYLKEIYKFESFELSKFPAYFSYPFERVIKARFEYLKSVKNLPIELIAPDVVLRFGDREFATKVAGDKDGGAAFLAYLKDRQGNSSKSRSKPRSGKKRKNSRSRQGGSQNT